MSIYQRDIFTNLEGLINLCTLCQLTFSTPPTCKPSSPNTSAPTFNMALHFSNYQDVERNTGAAFESPKNDETIPSTNVEQQPYVVRLFASIKATDNVRENTTTATHQNRWGPNATYYTDIDFEMVAWRVVHRVTKLHTRGWSWTASDSAFMKQIMETEGWTFEERIKIICELLKHSKTTCMELLKGEKLLTVTGMPHVLVARTANNQISNKRKADHIQAGKSQAEQNQAENNEAGNDQAGNKKRRQSNRTKGKVCTYS